MCLSPDIRFAVKVERLLQWMLNLSGTLMRRMYSKNAVIFNGGHEASL